MTYADALAKQAAYAERRRAWRETHPVRDVNEPPVEVIEREKS